MYISNYYPVQYFIYENTKECDYIFVIKLLIECCVNSSMLSEGSLNYKYLKELYRNNPPHLCSANN